MLVSGMIGLTKTMKNVIKMIKFQPETMMMELLWVETACSDDDQQFPKLPVNYVWDRVSDTSSAAPVELWMKLTQWNYHKTHWKIF